ncbi:MAG: universal stress protein [Thermodesulfobacteriota bacterium]
MNMERILWGADGSRESNDALNYAKLFAKAFEAEIIGIHVLKPVKKRSVILSAAD